MAFHFSPKVVLDGLVLSLDAANTRSYPGSGTSWLDLGKNQLTGTLTNGPTFESDNLGSIKFDGVDSYVQIPDNPSISSLSSISISAWVKFNTFSLPVGRQMIVEKHTSPTQGWWLAGQNNSLTWVVVTSTGPKFINNTNTFLNTTSIYNVVGTYNGTTGSIKVYVNSIDDGGTLNGTGTTGLVNSPNALYIGSEVNWFPIYGSTNIYNLSIYDTELSQSEVSQNFKALKSRFGL